VTRFTSLLGVAILATSALAQTETMPASRPGPPTIPADVGETKTTASGLKYCVLKEGAPGGKHPTENDFVKVHYTGWLTNGKLFDSSVVRNEPIEFSLKGVIAGWTEGVQLMTPGARFKFTIPSELGYGQQGSGGDIPPNATLIFEVELLSFFGFPELDETKLTRTPTGLKYQMLTEGTGAKPDKSNRVRVNYAGWLTDGKLFDASYLRLQPAEFGVTQVIPGWTEGLQLMKEGGVAIFVIPADIAYGARGKGQIPPNSTLVFRVELLKVR
jgi:peptidylprolyl isomerase